MAARFTWPSFSRSARALFSDSSKAGTAASAARPARISARSNRVAANCSTIPSRRTRDSCASRRAFSIASRAALTRVSASRRFSSSARNALSASSSARRSVASSDSIFQPPREEVFQLSFEFHDRQVTIGQRRFELGAANLRLRTLVGHALETHAHGGLTGATRFDADQQVATGELRRLRTCARTLHGFAAFFAFVFETRAARIELSESFQAAVEFGPCAGQRVLPEARLRE